MTHASRALPAIDMIPNLCRSQAGVRGRRHRTFSLFEAFVFGLARDLSKQAGCSQWPDFTTDTNEFALV